MQVETQKSARETRYKIAATDSYLASLVSCLMSHVSYRTSKLAIFPLYSRKLPLFPLNNYFKALQPIDLDRKSLYYQCILFCLCLCAMG